MNVIVAKRVYKDAEKLPKYAKELAAEEIQNLEAAETLDELPNVIHMVGTDEPYYRLKFNTYRYMLYYDQENETVEVLSLTHRKDTYKKQNLPFRR
jgi:mRNA-degrading endonuclease RelE of RelBE toxin-antitoxin system